MVIVVSPSYISGLGGELEVIRVNPLPAVAHHKGIAAVFPPHEGVKSVFSHLGEVFEVDTLEKFHKLHSASVIFLVTSHKKIIGRMTLGHI